MKPLNHLDPFVLTKITKNTNGFYQHKTYFNQCPITEK